MVSSVVIQESCYVRRVIYPLQSDLPVLRSVREPYQRTTFYVFCVRWLRHCQHVGKYLGTLQVFSVHSETVLFDFENNVAVAEPKRC